MPVIVDTLAQLLCGWVGNHDFEPSHVSPYDSEYEGRPVRIVFFTERCRRCGATSMEVRVEMVD